MIKFTHPLRILCSGLSWHEAHCFARVLSPLSLARLLLLLPHYRLIFISFSLFPFHCWRGERERGESERWNIMPINWKLYGKFYDYNFINLVVRGDDSIWINRDKHNWSEFIRSRFHTAQRGERREVFDFRYFIFCLQRKSFFFSKIIQIIYQATMRVSLMRNAERGRNYPQK